MNAEKRQPVVIRSQFFSSKGVSEVDFCTFLANATDKSFLASFLNQLSTIKENLPENTIYASLPLFINPENLSPESEEIIRTICQRAPKDTQTILRSICSKKINWTDFTCLWDSPAEPLSSLICALAAPTFIKDQSIFEHFLTSNQQFHHSFDQLSLIYAYSIFSPGSKISSQLLEKILPTFMIEPTQLTQELLATLRVESAIPFSSAALSLYNVLNSSVHPLFTNFSSPEVLRPAHSSVILQEYSVQTILNASLSSFEGNQHRRIKSDNLSSVFSKYVSFIRQAYLSDEFDPKAVKDLLFSNSESCGPESSEYVPLMHSFTPISTTSYDCSFPIRATFSGVPLAESKINSFFLPLQNQKCSVELASKMLPDSYIAVNGDSDTLAAVLNGYVTFLLNQSTDQLGRKPSFLLSPTSQYSLATFLAEEDEGFKTYAMQSSKLLQTQFPQINPKSSTESMDLMENLMLTNDPWRVPLSPYYAFQKFLSFYAFTAKIVTEFPIWICSLTLASGSRIAVPFIDSLFIGKQFCQDFATTEKITGAFQYSLVTSNGDSVGDQRNMSFMDFSIGILNYCPHGKPQCMKITDNALFVRIPKEDDKPNEEKKSKKVQILCCSMDFVSSSIFCAMIDSKIYDNIRGFSIDRLSHPQTRVGLNFPIRHFVPIDGFRYH